MTSKIPHCNENENSVMKTSNKKISNENNLNKLFSTAVWWCFHESFIEKFLKTEKETFAMETFAQ